METTMEISFDASCSPSVCIFCLCQPCKCHLIHNEIYTICYFTDEEKKEYQIQGQGQSNARPNQQSNYGTITNNYYENTYIASADMSTQANGNEGDIPEVPGIWSTLNGVVDTASAMAPLLLDQNTEETTNLSDRVKTSIHGNTSVGTQSSVGTVIGYKKEKDTNPISSCADAPTVASFAMERAFTQTMGTWSKTNDVYQYIHICLPSGIDDGGVFSGVLNRHYLMKCGYKVQVQMNASQFHSGSLGVFLIPEFTPQNNFEAKSTTFKPLPREKYVPEQLFVYPHQILNCRTNTSVDIQVPYCNFVPSSFNEIHNTWTLVVMVLTPLDYSTGAATDIAITTSITPLDVLYNGLRHLKEEGIPTLPEGSSYTFSTTNIDMAQPVYSKGFNPTQNYIPGKFTNLLQMSVTPTLMANQIGSEGESKQVGYFMCTNQVPTLPLFVSDVTLAAPKMKTTLVSAISQYFTQYRGSIVMDLVFTGTAMCKGKFVICYTPPGAAQPQTREKAMQGTYAVWDLGLNSSFKFTIPFISVSDYRWVDGAPSTSISIDGWFTIWQLTPITYPANNPNISCVLVFASAGTDFSYRNLTDIPMRSQGTEVGESGDTGNSNATENIIGTSISTEVSHSEIDFIFSRYFNVDTTRVTTYTGNEGITSITLSIYDFLQKPTAQALKRFLQIMTYFKSDLEIAITPLNTISTKMFVKWLPSGSVVDLTKETLNSINTPRFIKNTSGAPLQIFNTDITNVCTFRVPYTSVLGAIPITYNGYGDFSQTAYNVAPGADFGTLLFANTGSVGMQIMLSVRFVNMQCWIPRTLAPKISVTNTDANIIATRSALTEEIVFQGPSDFPTGQQCSCLNFFLLQENLEEAMEEISVLCSCNPSTKNIINKESLEAMYQVLSHMSCSVHYTWEDVGFDQLPTTSYSGCFCDRDDFNDVLETIGHNIWDLKSKGVDTQILEVYRMYISDVESENHWIRDLAADGDVEQNPGPASYNLFFSNTRFLVTKKMKKPRKEIQHQGFIDWLTDGAVTSVKDAAQNLTNVIQSTNKIMNRAFSCRTIIKIITDFLTSGLILYTCDFNPTIAAVLAIKHGLDMLVEGSVFVLITEQLKKLFKTDPPTIDGGEIEQQGVLRDFNTVVNAAKGIEWFLKTIQNLYDWLKSWCQKEEESCHGRYAKMMDTLGVELQVADNLISRIHESTKENLRTTIGKLTEYSIIAMEVEKTQVASIIEKRLTPIRNYYDQLYGSGTIRAEPPVVLLRGKPGCGKSVVSMLMSQAISKIVTGSQSVYTFPTSSTHMDGYKQQYVMVMDDLGQNPDGEDFKIFCQLVSTAKFVVPMASLMEKGTEFNTGVIIATTNLPEFKPVTIVEPGAVDRRITWKFTPEIRKEFLKDGKLNLELSLNDSGNTAPKGFTRDCPLINGKALTLNTPSGAKYSVAEAVDLIIGTLKHKSNVAMDLSGLVEQGVLDDMKLDDAAQEEILKILMQNNNIISRESSKQIFTRADHIIEIENKNTKPIRETIAWILAASGTFFTLILLYRTFFCSVKQGQGPYDGKLAKPRQFKEILAQAPDLELSVLRNCVPLDVDIPNKPKMMPFTALGLFELTFATNRHAIENCTSFEIQGHTYKIEDVDVKMVSTQDGKTDLAIVTLKKGTRFRNIMKHLLDEIVEPTGHVVGIVNSSLFPRTLFKGKALRTARKITASGKQMYNVFSYDCPTYGGYCGAPIIGQVGNEKKILGIHCAGDGTTGWATVITKNIVKKIEEQGLKVPIGEANPVCHVMRKSKICSSGFSYPTDVEPAILTQKDPRLDDGVVLDEKIFEKHQNNMETLPPVFEVAAKMYAKQVFSIVGKDNGEISTNDAINGFKTAEKMDLSTSPGYPYVNMGLRRENMLDNVDGVYTPKEWFNKNIAAVEEDPKDATFATFLKDELRPIAKARSGKTRIVDASPFCHAIVGRKLLLRFTEKFMVNNGTSVGSAIGTDPDCDWTRFYHELSNEYVFDLDYSQFDSTHPTAMFDLVKRHFFNTDNGFDEKTGKYLDSLSISKHVYGREKFLTVGGLPSGCSCTSMLNTVFNNIIIRAAILSCYEGVDWSDFKMLAYGDDVVYSSKDPILPGKIANWLHKNTTYKLTPANKTSTFPTESKIEDVTFLKRKFVTDGVLIRPVISRTNIENMLAWKRNGEFGDKIRSVAGLAFHLGEEEYNDIFLEIENDSQYSKYIPHYHLLDFVWKQKNGIYI
uniref:Genome polyprotein n=1 Tax=torchivirus A1 TaxID=1578826 RepID=A0A0A7ENP0_9PICO|nr:polyprotein [torchivirus A1]